ncbi:LOW QUALITY PROTEIN: transmembrane protein 44 [Monodelphis domestica]|uniref:LOW QUALITY PROTEIN: transmembrane protein 44 n=1 Tax=Monodelphis domestica TaxID=13616 RepID=UPI0024E1C895|nr:LOW QUALITY PROTEIN: transmembrane protein 44 [Monodelphis domestica]
MQGRLWAAGTPLAEAGPLTPPPPPGPGAWDYLAACFARDQVCLSFGLWLLAALFWIAAHVLCFYLGCSKKPSEERSVPGAIYRFVGSLSDAVGALLSGQLPIQVFTGIHLAAMEVVHLLWLLFPICGPKIKPKAGQCSWERPRRKIRASVFVLLVPLGVGTGWLTLAPPAPAPPEFHGAQRRLLGSVLQENTEALGYALGGVGLLVSWTSRIPSFSKLYRGRAFSGLQLWARGFSALAGFLYASAIVAHDRQPDYLRRAVPWFLISLGASALDLALIFLSCVLQSKLRRVLGFSLETAEPPDTQALLTRTCDSDRQEEEEAEEEENSTWVPLHMLPHTKYLQKMAAIGRYMELTIEHVQEVGCSTARCPAAGDPPTLLEPPAYPPVRVIHARVSSSSASDVSSISSELEQKYWEALNAEQWDPEDPPPARSRAPPGRAPGTSSHFSLLRGQRGGQRVRSSLMEDPAEPRTASNRASLRTGLRRPQRPAPAPPHAPVFPFLSSLKAVLGRTSRVPGWPQTLPLGVTLGESLHPLAQLFPLFCLEGGGEKLLP